ncbi:MAG: antibiotic biosynthesis monooxygenase [Prolixibacteraceae bacterium]|nr:antibiotic biosynthesis monooxygenase [Prolixibacteraceae bacterium]
MKTTILIITILTFFLISCQNKQQEAMSKENNQNLIVLVKYKTRPLKSEDAIAGLTKLIEEVKKEPNFVNITLHVDPKDDSNILLYEEWGDEAYYNGDHMKTMHLQNFMEDSRAFLADPPEISQWKIEKKFNSK